MGKSFIRKYILTRKFLFAIVFGGIIFSSCRSNVYTFVDKMPQYKGGEEAFLAEFSKNFKYDSSEKEESQTLVQLQFVIDAKGHLTGARIYGKRTDQYTALEKSALRTLSGMQDWEVGKLDGNPVNVIMIKSIHICPQ